jgi:UDP-N-acetylglucosamine acyltransferase
LSHFEAVIHPTAIIHANAKLDPTVQVGPYAVIDEGVEVGPNCVLGPHVYLTGQARIGSHNRFHAGCVIGDAPQDLKYQGEPTGLRIGDHNVFREHVTVHRSTRPGELTIVGSHNYMMANAHVGHNSTVGDRVIMANGLALGGHVTVADGAFLSGNAAVHQFVRVGTLSILQGTSPLSQDLPPFTMVYGCNELCGLNVVGLRRAGLSADDRLELKRVYHALFRSGRSLRTAVAEAREQFKSAAAQTLLDFVATTKRGVCTETRRRGNPGAETED